MTSQLPAIVTIPDLPQGTTVTGTELIEAVQTSSLGIAQSVQFTLAQAVNGVNAVNSATPTAMNVFQESGDTGWSAYTPLDSSNPGAHSTSAVTTLGIETRPVGSGGNGGAHSDIALIASAIKQSWPTTSVSGEMNGALIVVRQGGADGGGSDSSGLLIDGATMNTSGGMNALEFGVRQLQRGTFAVLREVHSQLCVIDTGGGVASGVQVYPTVPGVTIDYGYYVTDQGVGTVTNPFFYTASGGTKFFLVDTNGNVDISGVYKIGGNTVVDAAAWTSYTPSISAGAGTFTSVSATGASKQIGRTVHVRVTITITTNGTAATNVQATLPVTANGQSGYLAGRGNAVSGKMLQGRCLSASVTIWNYDGLYPGADGETLELSGTYEAA